MNRKETDLRKVRSIAIGFLGVDIAETKISFIANHPFTNTWQVCLPKEGVRGGEMVDLHDEENVERWRNFLQEQIENANLVEVFMMLNRPYILNFLKFVESYLTDEDLGVVLGSFWTLIEQISLDDSVTGKDLTKWFKRATKDKLMDGDELKKFYSFPEMITVYRGVTSHNKKKKKAFSWTTDKNIAVWFANRFNTGTGEVWTMNVPKERILCTFGGKEQEVIVNLYGYDGKMKVERLTHGEV